MKKLWGYHSLAASLVEHDRPFAVWGDSSDDVEVRVFVIVGDGRLMPFVSGEGFGASGGFG